jgi:pimeloyl-ACP methyl ester carboxylesterase
MMAQRPWRRWVAAGLIVLAPGCHRSEKRMATRPRPDQTAVFLFMGYGDQAWSGGLGRFASDLRGGGAYARVESYRKWPAVVREIVAERPAKLVLVGHSFGADAAVRTARALQEHGIAVRVLALLDASAPPLAAPGVPPPIPANVDIALEFYVVPTTAKLRPGPRARREPGNEHTELSTVAVGRRGTAARRVDHLTIDDSNSIRQLIAERMAAAGV